MLIHPVNRRFFNALFGHFCPYFALLPYNLNWAIRLKDDELNYLKQHPLVVLDVGARGAAPDELASFFPVMEYHAFDADPVEAERLMQSKHPYQNLKVYPIFVGSANEKVKFYLYKARAQSSIFKPAPRYKALFGGPDFEVETECELPATTLDHHYEGAKLKLPDMIKLDTQGSELSILRAATKLLKSVNMVEAEVEFLEHYQGQPLFHDVAAFLYDQGFELLYLNRHIGQRRIIFNGPARGQMVFGDALFGRRETALTGQSTEQLIKYMLLLINYGHIDAAFQIGQLHPAVFEELPSLRRYLKHDHYGPLVKRGLMAQFDKILLTLMRLRRTNQMSMDADRTWPMR
jgi:FkbM family methyltransferase